MKILVVLLLIPIIFSVSACAKEPTEAQIAAAVAKYITEHREELRGPRGLDGQRGPTGLTGLTGLTGPQGPRGFEGAPGGVSSASLSDIRTLKRELEELRSNLYGFFGPSSFALDDIGDLQSDVGKVKTDVRKLKTDVVAICRRLGLQCSTF